MKRFFITLVVLSVLTLSSCVSTQITDTPDEKNDEKETQIEAEVKNDTVPEEELPKKPENALEIISLADSFELDTSLTGFSLDGVLEEVQLSETLDAGEEYQNTTAYLGDSVTLGLGVFKNHPENMVIAKGSISPFDAVNKKLITLADGTSVNFPDALATLNAKRAVLTFGANAISIMSEETFLNYYIDLIDKIKEACPDCEIIIQSISPIATTCTLKKFTNTLINRANSLLLVLAYSKDAHFLNSAPALKGDDGYLKPEYCSSADGIHINEMGYSIWIDYLRTHALISE